MFVMRITGDVSMMGNIVPAHNEVVTRSQPVIAVTADNGFDTLKFLIGALQLGCPMLPENVIFVYLI